MERKKLQAEAKAAGIKGWYQMKTETLKERLGYEKKSAPETKKSHKGAKAGKGVKAAAPKTRAKKPASNELQGWDRISETHYSVPSGKFAAEALALRRYFEVLQQNYAIEKSELQDLLGKLRHKDDGRLAPEVKALEAFIEDMRLNQDMYDRDHAAILKGLLLSPA